MRKLICVSTNNGWDYIGGCLDAYRKFNTDWEIAVADTFSSDLSFREHVGALCAERGHEFIQLEAGHYDFGAYAAAWRRHGREYDRYFFHHDSVWPKSPDSMRAIDDKLDRFDIVPWLNVPRAYCPFGWAEDRQFCLDHFGTDQYQYLVYGSNLAIRSEALERIWPMLESVVTTNKKESCAMERGWGILAEQFGLSRDPLDGIMKDHHDWYNVLHADGYRFFVKKHSPAGVRL